MENVRLFSNKNSCIVVPVKLLPDELRFINFYVEMYCLKYGAVTFIDDCGIKRTYIMNWNLPEKVLEKILLYHQNRISRTEYEKEEL